MVVGDACSGSDGVSDGGALGVSPTYCVSVVQIGVVVGVKVCVVSVGEFWLYDDFIVRIKLDFSFQSCIDIVVLCVFCLLVVVGEIISIRHVAFFTAVG